MESDKSRYLEQRLVKRKYRPPKDISERQKKGNPTERSNFLLFTLIFWNAKLLCLKQLSNNDSVLRLKFDNGQSRYYIHQLDGQSRTSYPTL